MSDNRGLWHPIWSRGGKVDEIAWIGKEVIVWSSGLYFLFFHVSQKRECLRWSSTSENVDGMCCLSGHPTIHLLAYSDKSFLNPKIHIHSYPSMKKISECVGGSENGYLATAFNTADNLISLATHPNYSLTIWAWRSGERLSSIDTTIRDMDGQFIRVTCGKSTLIGQLGRPSGKLHIWETNPAGKTVIFRNHEVMLPNGAMAYHMDWTPDSAQPLLAVVDKFSHIYISNEDGSIVHRIVLTQRCGVCLDYEAPSVCWFRDGIILKTTFCQIRFFKKNEKDFWHKEWYVKLEVKPRTLNVHPLRKDKLFYHTEEGFLTELDVIEGRDNPLMEKRMYQGGIYVFADIVRPWGHHMVVINDPSKINVLDCYDGRQVAELELHLDGDVTQLLSHPDIPMVAVTSICGELALLTLLTPENPFFIAKFHLQRERLDFIKFSHSGNNLVVGQRTTGICYCVSLTLNKPLKVIARGDTRCRMVDVLFYDIEGHLKLLVLVVSSRRVPVGRQLLVYDLQSGQNGHIEPTSYLELPYAYQFLHYAPEGHCNVIGTAYLSRQIHLLKIEDWKRVVLVEVMISGHQVRRARLFTDRRWIISAAIDGLITLRSGKTQKLVATIKSHHRTDLGLTKSMAQPSGNIVVGLGHDGSLIGIKFNPKDDSMDPDESSRFCRNHFDEYEKKKDEILLDYSNLDKETIKMLLKTANEFNSAKNDVNKTWVELTGEEVFMQESEQCMQRRMAVRQDFSGLQQKLMKLLDENEACPDIERLPIAAFDLDKMACDQKIRSARDERENVQLELDYICTSMHKVANWIKSNFWDCQKIHDRSIFPFYGNDEITNYDMSSDTPEVADMLQLARLYWDDNSVADGTLSPAKLQKSSKLQVAQPKQGRFDSANERQRMDDLLGTDYEDDGEIDPEEIDDKLAKTGMTTHRFFEPSDQYSSQFEKHVFFHFLHDNQNVAKDCARLRDHFNKLFVEICGLKEREMGQLRERYERIRYIDSELRLMFGTSVAMIPIDPEWNCKEIPGSVVEVRDHEVKVKPYVSPSQRELLNKQVAEAERLRQNLLADDFREKALVRMMDGVLEIRWEDMIKKDIEKPRCMLIKDPDEFNADDLLAIRQYDKDVENLDQERLRYRRLLETEYARIGSLVQENIEKFNGKFQELMIIKMKVESAIQQLNLRNLRGWLGHMCQMRALRDDNEIRAKIIENKNIVKMLDQEISSLRNIVQDYRNQYEALLTREKVMEKKIHNDFPSLRKIFIEMLEKEYKRRPRIGLKNVTSNDLVELGRNAAACDKASWLTHECLEYLRHLETMDARPSGLPPVIEDHTWDHVKRARRNKIDLEMKLRAKLAEINQTDRTIDELNEKIDRLNAAGERFNEKLNKMKAERIDFEVDLEIQLILKMGQVEIQMSGRRDDAMNASFVRRGDIDAVNATIKMVGTSKLSAMNRTVNFRCGLRFKEWEHECRRSTIVDLSEDLCMMANVLVTRDVRDYLKTRLNAQKEDKTGLQLQKELEAMRTNCEKRLEKWLIRLKDVDDKIIKTKRDNKTMDAKIEKINVDRWELEWRRDLGGEAKQKEYHDRRMAVVVKRSRLVRTLQETYTDLLATQTEHELYRLRTFPALSYFKTLDDEEKKNNIY